MNTKTLIIHSGALIFAAIIGISSCIAEPLQEFTVYPTEAEWVNEYGDLIVDRKLAENETAAAFVDIKAECGDEHIGITHCECPVIVRLVGRCDVRIYREWGSIRVDTGRDEPAMFRQLLAQGQICTSDEFGAWCESAKRNWLNWPERANTQPGHRNCHLSCEAYMLGSRGCLRPIARQ